MRIFDLHNDTFSKITDQNLTLTDKRLAVNCGGMNKYKTAVCQFAVWLSGQEQNAYDRYKKVLENGKAEFKKHGIKICTTANDLESVKDTGKAALLSLEGGIVINSTEMVESLFRDGIRTVSLTWNHDNDLAGGALGQGALTDFGKAVIQKLNQNKMVLDLSHLNRKSFFDCLEYARYVAATHTGLDALVPHKRNLTDEQLKTIKQKRGLIGLCLYPEFIGQNVMEDFTKAVEHALDLGLEDNLSLGSDFDGADMNKELCCLADVGSLYEKCEKIFGNTIAEKIFFYNSYNFYVNVLTNGHK